MNIFKLAALMAAVALPFAAPAFAQQHSRADGGVISAPPDQPTTPLVDSNAAAAPVAPVPMPVSNDGATPAASAARPTVTGAAPPSQNTLANAVQARTPEEQANQTGFQIITALDHWLGMGTFIDAKSFSYLSANLTVQPQVLFGVKGKRLAASATLRGSYEYTLPDNDTGRRFSPGDIRLGLSAPALFRDKAFTGVSVTPSAGLVLPTSPESWNAGLITSFSLGLAATRSIAYGAGGFDFRLALGGSRGFFTGATNSIRASSNRDSFGNLLVVCRTGEAACATAGQNTAWSANAGAQVNWRINGEVIAYAGYTFIKTWREAAAVSVDDQTPKGVDSGGNPVARAGYGQVDRTSAFFGVSYQLNEHYSLDLGIATVQTPLTATGQVRFPFFSFGAIADNSTTAYFTLTAAY